MGKQRENEFHLQPLHVENLNGAGEGEEQDGIEGNSCW